MIYGKKIEETKSSKEKRVDRKVADRKASLEEKTLRGATSAKKVVGQKVVEKKDEENLCKVSEGHYFNSSKDQLCI